MTVREADPSVRGLVATGKVYLRPLGLVAGAAADALLRSGAALPLAGGPLAFTACEVIVRRGPSDVVRLPAPVSALPDEAQVAAILHRLMQPRRPVAGVRIDSRPAIMGVINVTPDSFFDGGRSATPAAAVTRGNLLLMQGADILDVGGESTRPGAVPVPEGEELQRVIPVVRALALTDAVISIDTRHASVMRAAVAAGARIINDVAALGGDGALEAAASLDVPVVLMHSNADPRTMQDDPRYDDVVLDVYEYLEGRAAACEAVGIPREMAIVDPGIGFAKTAAHNAALLESLALFHGLGCPILLGVSRKSFIARFSAGEPADARLPGSLAAAQWGAAQGVQILRVHDVAETGQAMAVARTAADPRRLPPRPSVGQILPAKT